MASVVFTNVTKHYPGAPAPALHNFSLTVNDGEFLALVGPSGCGKTTFLRLLAGLEDADSGHIFLGERDITATPARQRDIAMVFQNYALYPHKTVRENMAFSLKIAKMPRAEIERRISHTAEILHMGDILDRKPGALSGGQRQRVAMGRAIVREPHVFLMDEPLSNLDAQLRVQTRAEISSLQHRLGITTVYVTHDQTEAMTMGDRIAVMNGGVLQHIGTPQDVYERPANMFVAGFIGSPAMNFLRVGQYIAGIRPESFTDISRHPGAVAGGGPMGTQATPGEVWLRVLFVEHLGPDSYIYGRFLEPGLALAGENMRGDEYQCIVRVDPQFGVAPGDVVRAVAPVKSIHYFTVDTGARVEK